MNFGKRLNDLQGEIINMLCAVKEFPEGLLSKQKIGLWHQEVNGREESFFDWEITPDYCRSLWRKNLLSVERGQLQTGTAQGKQPDRSHLF
ncbi:hypothetical protein [Viscerimonas tarda]